MAEQAPLRRHDHRTRRSTGGLRLRHLPRFPQAARAHRHHARILADAGRRNPRGPPEAGRNPLTHEERLTLTDFYPLDGTARSRARWGVFCEPLVLSSRPTPTDPAGV